MNKYEKYKDVQESIIEPIFLNIFCLSITIDWMLIFFVNKTIDDVLVTILILFPIILSEWIIYKITKILFERKLKTIEVICWMLDKFEYQQEASQLIMLPADNKKDKQLSLSFIPN